MKRDICFLLAIIVLFTGYVFYKDNNKTDIENKLIRFHVIANSDLDLDQNIKLKVRDAILHEIGPQLDESKSKNESLQIIEKNRTKIENVANNVLAKEGKQYKAKTFIGKFQFPIKTYGTITLPAGEYTALRVVLGSGEGRNWWCVMFPPLCFTDVTRGLTTDKTDVELSKVMNNKELKAVTTFNSNVNKRDVTKWTNYRNIPNKGKATSKENKVVFKCKTVEIFKDAVSKIKAHFK